METIIKIELPLTRLGPLIYSPRWYSWIVMWTRGSISEFGGSRVNTRFRFFVFRWHVLTIHRNQYHDRTDAERADEYLREWSKCEKELRMFRLAALGEGVADDVKQVIKESLGVDLDEGTVR